MRTELVIDVLDTLSFVLVTPRLVGIDNLRSFNRSGFSFLSRTLFETDRPPTLRSMIAITVGLLGGIALTTLMILPWIRSVDTGLFGAGFNAAHAMTPLNISLGMVAFLFYGVVPITLLTGWLEVMMTRHDPEGAMLLAGGLLFAVARFLAIVGAAGHG